MKNRKLKYFSAGLLLLIIPVMFNSVSLNSAVKSRFVETYKSCETTGTSSFKGGEHLNYKVYYNWKFTWLAAGVVDFTVDDASWNNEPVLHTSATGRTLRAYEWFYKVNDVYDSYIHPETFKPVHFVRDVNEGGYTIECDYDFDHTKGEVFVNHRKTKGKIKQENEAVSIDDCTYDMLSAIYLTRNIDYNQYAVNDVITIDVFMDGKIQEIHMQFGGIETIKTKLGRFECVKIHPTLHESYLFEGGKKMTVWATNDANRMPIMVEAPLRVGSIKAMLTDYANISFDLTAQVKKK